MLICVHNVASHWHFNAVNHATQGACIRPSIRYGFFWVRVSPHRSVSHLAMPCFGFGLGFGFVRGFLFAFTLSLGAWA